MAIASTVNVQNDLNESVGSNAAIAIPTASQAEVKGRVNAPDDNEITRTATITNARTIAVHNESTTSGNYLSVGFATGVYAEAIPPGASTTVYLTSATTNPSLFFKFSDAGGGWVRYGVWD